MFSKGIWEAFVPSCEGGDGRRENMGQKSGKI